MREHDEIGAAVADNGVGLPDGVEVGELPVPIDGLSEGVVEIHTEDELTVLHALSGWALERKLRLPGLAVARVTLEDVYLRLTRDEQ